MKNRKNRKEARIIRHWRVRKKIFGTPERPRLAVFVSNKNFYAQVIDDESHNTILSFSTLQLKSKNLKNNRETAIVIGREVAKLAKEKNIKSVVFDRGGFLFHGKVKSFADEIRKEGVKF